MWDFSERFLERFSFVCEKKLEDFRGGESRNLKGKKKHGYVEYSTVLYILTNN